MIDKLWPGKVFQVPFPSSTPVIWPPKLRDWRVGDSVVVMGNLATVVHIEPKTLTVTYETVPTERQETLGRLLGRPPEDFIS